MNNKMKLISIISFLLFATISFADSLNDGYIVQPVDASSSSYWGDRYPVDSINGTGFDSSETGLIVTGSPVPQNWPTHVVNPAHCWLANGQTQPYIIFDLGQVYTIGGFHLWNYNESPNYHKRSIRTAVMSFASEGDSISNANNYSEIGFQPQEMAMADGLSEIPGETYAFNGDVEARFIKINVTSNWGDGSYSGFSEIRFIVPGQAAPKIRPVHDEYIIPGQVYIAQLEVSQGFDAIYTKVNLPDGMELNQASGQIQWLNPVSSNEPYVLTVGAENDYGYHEMTWNLFVGNDISNVEVIAEDAEDWENQIIIVNGQTVTIEGAHSFNAIRVQKDQYGIPGTIVIKDGVNESSQLMIKYNITVDEGCFVVADGQGYSAGIGDGAGADADTRFNGGGGGSYGGLGGKSVPGGGDVYGLSFEPIDFGSGGGNDTDGLGGGAGGGAIRINAESIIVNGVISSNGQGAQTEIAGGGSGGSIWIETNELSGSGVFLADGGNGRNGGGGGRIAVYYNNAEEFTGFVSSAANGGEGFRSGDSGTILFADKSTPELKLHIYNYFDFHQDQSAPEIELSELILHSGAIGVMSDVTKIIADKITIEEGAFLTATGYGYGPDEGVGAGGYSEEGAGGGALGGSGGRGAYALGGEVYGSSFTPIEKGSGGGSAGSKGKGGKGGGAIQLIVNELIIDGVIESNGLSGTAFGGGGAGGSIYIDAISISGSGYFEANGGDSGSPFSGGGAGGRIAVYYESVNEFTGFISSEAVGGSGRMSGREGTVGFFDKSITDMQLSVYRSFELFDGDPKEYYFNRINVYEGAELRWGNAISLRANDMLFADNSFINADGFGYSENKGLGAGQAHAEGSGGAGHGGKGGRGRFGDGGQEYGSINAPDQPGSGGGSAGVNDIGGKGGGALQLIIEDTFTFNGSISASGTDGLNLGGGGSGGSIWVTAGTIIGTGTFHADGGNGGSYLAGGGSGGRILLQYGFADDYTGFSSSTATGGTGRMSGPSGTVVSIADDGSVLILDIPDDVIPAYVSYQSPIPLVLNAIEPVSWTLVDGPDDAEIDPSTGIVIWDDPIVTGSPVMFTIKAVSFDSSGEDEESWQITVKEMPQVKPFENSSVLIDQAYTGIAPVLLNNPGEVIWSLTSKPADMTIDSTTGVVSWSKSRISGSPYTVTIRVTNEVGYSEVSYELRVLDRPFIDNIADLPIPNGQQYVSQVPTLSGGSGEIVWSIVEAPEDVSIDSYTGQVTWDSPVLSDQPYTITIKAENADGNDEESWQVTVLEVPEIAEMADASVSEGGFYLSDTPQLLNNAIGVTWSIISAPSGATINKDLGVISWSDANRQGSPYTITIQASNAVGSDTGTWNLTVDLGSPYINDVSDIHIPEGIPYTGPIPTLRYGDDQLNWTLAYSPEGMEIDSASGIVSWPNPTLEGSPHYISIIAENPVGVDYEGWQVIVDTVPVLNPIEDDIIIENQPYYSPVPTLQQSTFVSWKLVEAPSGMSIDRTTGAVSWSKARLDGSPHNIKIQASNTAGVSEISWQLTVMPAPPVIQQVNQDYYVEGTYYIGPKPTLAQGTYPITWSLVDGPAGMKINASNGIVTWPEPIRESEPYTIIIKAENATGYDQASWTLKPLEIPEISPIEDVTISIGSKYVGVVPIITVDTRVVWSLREAPIGMTINPETGQVTWNSPQKDGTPHTVTVRAQNELGYEEVTWVVNVLAAPVIAAIGDYTIPEGAPYTGPTPQITSGISPITWTLDDYPEGMTFDESTGTVSWDSPVVTGYAERIEICATNPDGKDCEAFYLSVLAPPLINQDSVYNQTIPGGQQSYVGPQPLLAHGSPPITWKLLSGPEGMTIDSKTGIVVWYNPTHIGSPYTIAIEAVNTKLGSEYNSDGAFWELTVLEPPVIGSIPDHTANEDADYVGPTPQIISGDTNVIWSLTRWPAGMEIDPETGVIAWESPRVQYDPYLVTIQAKDSNGSIDTESWYLSVPPSYTAVVSTDIEETLAGTAVELTGQAFDPVLTTPKANVEVKINVNVKGFKRSLSAITNSSGNFQTMFYPLDDEAGRYTIAADHPGMKSDKVDDEFVIYGMKTEPSKRQISMLPDTQNAGQVKLKNLADVELTGISYEMLRLPTGINIQFVPPSRLKPSESVNIPYVITALTREVNDSILINLTSDQGASAQMEFMVSVKPKDSKLTAKPGSLYAGMLRGYQTLVSFNVTNTGGDESGVINVELPDADWLKLTSPATLPPLMPGESVEIIAQLLPNYEMPLGDYKGKFLVKEDNSYVYVPFTFRAISNGTGDIVVTATDEYSYFAEDKPNVTASSVVLTNAVTGKIAATGITDNTGKVTFTELPEGYYHIKATADKHHQYKNTILVKPAEVIEEEAFMQRETVTYNWTVTPTQIEDHYNISIETEFETNVPAPVLTIEPSMIHLFDYDFIDGVTQIDVTLTNHGLIAFENISLNGLVIDNGIYDTKPLVLSIDKLSAKTSINVPLIVTLNNEIESEDDYANAFNDSRIDNFEGSSVKSKASTTCKEPENRGDDWCIGHSKNGFKDISKPVLCSVDANICGGNRDIGVMKGRYINVDCVSYQPGFQVNYAPNEWGKILEENCSYKWIRVVVDESFKTINDKEKVGNECLCSETSKQVIDLKEYTNPCLPMNPSEYPYYNKKSYEKTSRDSPTLFYPIPHNKCYFHNGQDDCKEYEEEDVWRLSDLEFHEYLLLVGDGVDKKLREIYECKEDVSGVVVLGGFRWGMEGVYSPESPQNIKGGVLSYKLDEIVCDSSLDDLKTAISKTTFAENWKVLPSSFASDCCVKVPEECLFVEGCYYCGEIRGQKRYLTIKNKCYECKECDQSDEVLLNPVPKPAPTPSIYSWPSEWYETGVSCKPVQTATKSLAQGTVNDDCGCTIKKSVKVSKASGDTLVTAAAEDQGVCATVKLRLDQEAVLTRDAFDAKLELINHTIGSLTDVGLDILITDADGNDLTDLFGIHPPTYSVMTNPDGSGILAANSTGTAHWIIVPTTEAVRSTEPKQFYVGGTLSYTESGNEINAPLTAVEITVYPQPELDLKYFHQRDVFSDDPWTGDDENPIIEPAMPYELAVLVENKGYGLAKNLRIKSAQPQIVENEKGLLIDFKIIGSEIDGQQMEPSLNVNFGNIDPNDTRIARWWFTSSLQGLFIDYKATFEYVDGLGDPRLSLIKNVEIHELIHSVRADGVYADGKTDFLVNDIEDEETYDMPDTLHLSDGGEEPVEVIQEVTFDGSPSPADLHVEMTAGLTEGWNYIRVADPSSGSVNYKLVAVYREDGSELPTENFWQTDRTFIGMGKRPILEDNLHLFDYGYGTTAKYTFVYSIGDIVAPVVQAVDVHDVINSQVEGTYAFNVTYTDDAAIDIFSLNWQDVKVTGPNGYHQFAKLTAIDQKANGTPRTATYSITAPGGGWDVADNGTYELILQSEQVSDTSGNYAQTQLLGTFEVAIAEDCKPQLVEYELVNTERVGRTIYEHTYSVKMANTCSLTNLEPFIFIMTNFPANVEPVNNTISFDAIEPGQEVVGKQTIKLRIDHSLPFNINSVPWTFDATGCLCDLDDSGSVDIYDLAMLTESWLQEDALADIVPVPDGDNVINILDFSQCAMEWLKDCN